jgi:hypothetical protein
MQPEMELREADLGDARLGARLRRLVDAFTACPASAIPEACAGMVDQAYRFFDNPNVRPDDIRAAHYADTRARWPAGDEPVLVASDTTWIDFTSHPRTRGLGYESRLGQNGLFLHSTLACTESGVPLGMLDQLAWVRDPADFGKKATRASRPTAEKESQRWLDALQAAIDRRPPGRRVIFLADREGDLYDLFAQPRPDGVDLIVRADRCRRLDGEADLLGAVAARAAALGTARLRVPRKDGGPEREAGVEVRVLPARLAVPSGGPRRPGARAVAVTAVLATEPSPPEGAQPLDWLLLTTLAVPDLAEAVRALRRYACRWCAERYHFTLKSGCAVERLQLEERERLERAVAVYTVVAVRLLRLSRLAEAGPQSGCEAELRTVEWEALAAECRRKLRAELDPARPGTLKEAVYWISRLGGYVGRGKKARPGVKVLWRGLRRLHDLAAGYELGRQRDGPPGVQSSVE